MLWSSFLTKQALTGTLQSSCSKEIFGKVPGSPVSTPKKDSTMDVLLKSMQKHSEQLFFHETMGRFFIKFKYPFSRTPMYIFE